MSRALNWSALRSLARRSARLSRALFDVSRRQTSVRGHHASENSRECATLAAREPPARTTCTSRMHTTGCKDGHSLVSWPIVPRQPVIASRRPSAPPRHTRNHTGRRVEPFDSTARPARLASSLGPGIAPRNMPRATPRKPGVFGPNRCSVVTPIRRGRSGDDSSLTRKGGSQCNHIGESLEHAYFARWLNHAVSVRGPRKCDACPSGAQGIVGSVPHVVVSSVGHLSESG